ncbi:S9 family peptidase [Marinobacterium sediminicola]|uniref:Dipeptidyl aminopeptidase/acylaminoacyl peptidase n=1 Tax=Marinobacterium sediminicola TaxID=518898 RepID=A0ABY1S2P8_9GAMM|nr:prolyl oligopeptidase family serine peptidase [Marinobacterium sediminicola]ULG70669.1 prolyl oligopeptidase family serine peptidase [Marinobacterium sediminicola]SMR77173.1 Dipeptidyl aminopeptidase/acylaminoacyl peptidase [Marinobacterium sediminicola]
MYSPEAEHPLSADAAVAALHDYSTLRFYRGDVIGISFDAASGRNRLCRFAQANAVSLLPDSFSVRSRVHEYGGGAWCLVNDHACFINDSDQQVWLSPLDMSAQPEPLTRSKGNRFADLQYDAIRNRLIAVFEAHDSGEEAINSLVSIDLETGDVEVLVKGADFYSSPVIRPDGNQLAWIEWDHPSQPWRCTRLMLAQLDQQGRLIQPRQLSDKGDVAWAQPRFSPQGVLHVVGDRRGWWQIEMVTEQGIRPLAGVSPEHTEFTTAPWQFGLSTYAWDAEGHLLALGQSEGYSRLWRHEGDDWQPVELSLMPARLHALIADGKRLACVAEFSDRLSGILAIDSELTPDDPDQCELLRGGEMPHYTPSLPLSLSVPVAEFEVPFFLYRPVGAPSGQPLPLIIWTHGGPTAATAPVFKPAVQFWTQRGFMIADVNYRGSTGYGRDYRLQLAGKWGTSDVEDVEAVASDLIAQGLADSEAVFIRGNSAGGYTTLSALCRSELFRGGASLYGVSDPARLNELTHKFESRYLHWLIGNPETEPERYTACSPLEQAHHIGVPVIFFQGEQDRVVLPQQTEVMAERLRANGVRVETHYFADEAHGFRQPENQALVLERELAFYRSIIESR